MAKIVINEISQNYSYNIGNNSFAGVAFPITACWGPAYQDYKAAGFDTECQMKEHSAFYRFPATKEGLESFVSTFRGPAANYRLAKDYSYQMAMTLLTAGYDVHVCRVSPGLNAEGTFAYGSFAALAEEPDDWSTNYGKYFVLDADKGTYVPVKAESTVEYTQVGSGATKPGDWDSTYNTDYYVLDDNKYVLNTESTWSNAKDLPIYTASETAAAPEFVAGKYFNKTSPDSKSGALKIKAKYPGTFGNNLRVRLVKSNKQYIHPETNEKFYYWNLITYVVDNAGVQTSAENLIFVFELDHMTDNIPHITEIESNFLTIDSSGVAAVKDDSTFTPGVGSDSTTNATDDIRLAGGTDRADTADKTVEAIMADVKALATARYEVTANKGRQYLSAIDDRTAQVVSDNDKATAEILYYREWCYNAAFSVLDLLKDKLAYSFQALILPGWDDQDITDMNGRMMTEQLFDLSPLHIKMMEVGYYSRCATAHIDIPRSCLRKFVSCDRGENGHECDPVTANVEGYAQLLARYVPDNADYDVNTSLYTTHSALFAPWRKYTYVGMGRQADAPPSFLALMIHRAQLLNQSLQYFWALPTNRKHSLKIGKAQYATPGKILNVWQRLEGVGVNVITEIPDVGTTIWGNSTLFEVPPAIYQALANLSTRYLVNAVEDTAYRCGISITFQYNNNQAYNKFYAGVTPILETMRNVGAIEDYHVEMSADVNGLDQVNANSVIGKIYLVINGVINDITVDLIALPQGTNLDEYR